MAATHHNLVCGGLGKRQDSVVLQQHQRLAHRLARHSPMGRRTHLGRVAAVGLIFGEQTQCKFLLQNAQYGIIDARHGYPARVDFSAQRTDKGSVIGRHHYHINTSIDRIAHLRGIITRQLLNGMPVCDHKPLKTQFAL